ncbi:Sulfate transporter 1.3 [Sesamum angolense]|uniref:Sulfate transporter 1.3 n=1 Tax=Sesamum angolense TaxID=2727404 RepID=A0AAE1X4D7_9LAMI|nr:Sulfate transporter 1.3 [Sesamum angolense]
MSGGRVATETDIASAASSRRYAENAPYVHKVGMPPKQSLFQEFTFMFKETFFHDDPLRPFKDQPRSRKLQLGIQAVFPILDWGRKYKLHMLKGDLIAGLTIASLCIPQDIGYAKLANLDPQFGLYSSFVPPLIYAIMGSSRDIAIGPVAVVSLLLGSMVQKEIDPKHKPEYQRLMFTATFFAGVTQFLLGFFRLGFLIDFLSHAAIVGFMAGAAITISLQQLKGLLGVKTFTKKTDIVSVMRSVWTNVHHGGKKNKKLFWVPAIAPLISVIISTLCVFITHAEKKEASIPPSVHKIHFTGSYVAIGFRIGAIAGMIGLTEAVAIGRTFAAMKDYHLDGNKEMVALGSMNIIGSMTSCYVATGSFSRSAVNYMAGCNTAFSNIVMSLVVLLTLELITPLFKYTPNAILASIIISAVVGLFDYEAMILIWKIDKFDFVACMGAFFGVVFVSVEIGLLIAVAISFAKILLQVTRPRTAVLGKIPRTTVYRNIQQYPEATKVHETSVTIASTDDIVFSEIMKLELFFSRILRLLADEEEEQKANSLPRIQSLIVEMSPVTDIDTSGIHALEDLYKSLKKRGVQLALANPGQIVLDKLHTSDFANTVGDDKIFLTVGDAVMTLAP